MPRPVCGDVSEGTNNGETTDRTMVCSSDPIYLCGGPSMLQPYLGTVRCQLELPSGTRYYTTLAIGIPIDIVCPTLPRRRWPVPFAKHHIVFYPSADEAVRCNFFTEC